MTVGEMILQMSVKMSIFFKMVLSCSRTYCGCLRSGWGSERGRSTSPAQLVETMWTGPLLPFSFAVVNNGANTVVSPKHTSWL